jgi:hypothetical protein
MVQIFRCLAIKYSGPFFFLPAKMLLPNSGHPKKAGGSGSEKDASDLMPSQIHESLPRWKVWREKRTPQAILFLSLSKLWFLSVERDAAVSSTDVSIVACFGHDWEQQSAGGRLSGEEIVW